jgi:hypothetical protein
MESPMSETLSSEIERFLNEASLIMAVDTKDYQSGLKDRINEV